MSNAETPAENTGGTTATSTAGALADLPARIRVHALAKLVGSSSREVMAKLAELGEPARSVQSSVPKDTALRVAGALGVLDEAVAEAAEATPAAVTATPATEPAPAGGDTPGAGETPATSEAAAETGQAAPETPAAAPERAAAPAVPPAVPPAPQAAEQAPPAEPPAPATSRTVRTPVFAAPSPVFLPPEPVEQGPAPKTAPGKAEQAGEPAEQRSSGEVGDADTDTADTGADDTDDTEGGGRRRRRRGRRGRGRGKGGDDNQTGQDQDGQDTQGAQQAETAASEGKAEERKAEEKDEQAAKGEDGADSDDGDSDGATRRRRRRRRRKGGGDDDSGGEGTSPDDPPNTVVHVRDAKSEGKSDSKADTKGDARDGVRSVRGSTRLEAKRQRRRDGREAGRRRAPILSEAEFLARRESVERTMVVAERGDSTQIGVLEDGVLVEHFVTSSGSGSIVGNVYLGRVQNVLPSMEAAFIDIGRGRNAVLYAGEVDWDAAGLEGKARKIEQALSTGDNVLVQVTKDPVGHKGARLTTQISLPGRFLVYVPAGGATGISRKLPENERRRLKDILKRIVPEDAGVIIRTASEGISEEELGRDVRRLKAQWEVIKEKADSATGQGKKSSAPVLLYEEPDLLVKVVRDLFTEDFVKLEVQGDTAWETIHAYVEHVAPDLTDRLKRYVGTGDVFADYRIDEQLTKALDRKVWLPSGGYLVIDRTEAMTVIDVNTGKFTGSGGNLEETVTRNNLESAEEIVRQLRLRDIGGIIVIDFIDMVLESNRELVLRRLTECLGRDRTRHQVAEVTSLGLVQMTRKRVGTGLLEAFSTTCEHCKGRGVLVGSEPHRGNGHNGGQQHGGGGNGGGGGSRRSRGRNKNTEDQDTARSAEPAQSGPTPGQRESVVSAVQAMANASKVTPKAEESAADRPETARSQGDGPKAKKPKTDKADKKDKKATPDAVEAETSQVEQPQAAEQQPRDRQQEEPAAQEPAQPVNGHARAPEPVESGAAEQPAQPEATGEEAPAAAQQDRAEPQPEESQADTQAVPAPATRTTTRRPRRRAASRPAGPPVHAQENS
ncbi:Rne/Rng family ribonuclease [Prauserella muralis]|uniref:Ribonuclease E n=1 Tax=Prauserella muralis TaxID=588067 RepID=A0A2V4B298_9PSEU|nr:Rne/Rng family ribonuclease [Prauserella muralis]PXY27518.1 ribonuclease E [Prauserella muralis]TWE22762.1 ribonuclease E [Prauserella muralis]